MNLSLHYEHKEDSTTPCRVARSAQLNDEIGRTRKIKNVVPIKFTFVSHNHDEYQSVTSERETEKRVYLSG